MTGSELVKLFNAVGCNDEYVYQEGGLPGGLSRGSYALKRLEELNRKPQLKTLLEALADSRRVSNPDEIAAQVNAIIRHDGYKLEKDDSHVYRITGKELDDPIAVEAHFQGIRAQLLECIESARFIVWVAVAWFTDKQLGNALRERHRSGVNVRVIVNDDEMTELNGLKFDAKGIEYTKVAPDSPWGKKLMHNKFCVIDLRTVVHGSYNWTGSAQYNNESITITESRELAEEFAAQFIELKNQKTA
jgi:phosphatidylserine/phosphatidylglycerophosphate/cardiolipin synthase-like enzyme